MAYPPVHDEDIERFRRQGFLVVRDAIDPKDLVSLERACDRILEKKHKVAFDWAWDQDRSKEERLFRIVQASPSTLNPGLLSENPFRIWMHEFAARLLGLQLEFWYDQFLAKPPDISAATDWHQDEGYWGRNLNDKGITCWLPMHDVDENNGCMFFVPGGHKGGILEHRRVAGTQSDLLHCEVDASKAIACPLRLGDVTFHHSKTPHMTPRNKSRKWRRALTNHFKFIDAQGEGDHFPWKVYVNQYTGEVTVPDA